MTGLPTWTEALAAGLPPDGLLLIVDARRQQLTLFERGCRIACYPVSTAAAGLGCEDGSLKTPVGWHEVLDRIGRGAPLGQVFESRLPTGEIVDLTRPLDGREGDPILTRILRLRGLEPGKNHGQGVDSYLRMIYIHGTHREDRLGTPASCGCIRMANRDVAALFEVIGNRPAWCWIGESGAAPQDEGAEEAS